MELTRHPEYPAYARDRETDRRGRLAIAAWVRGGETLSVSEYSLRWTVEGARGFVRAWSRFFQAYNRVLWDRFPYCRRCGGGCCVVGASRVTAFDVLALTLLGYSLPDLPPEIGNARDCIYLAGKACAWPTAWRPLKCWSFYCLGDRWDPTSSLQDHYAAVAGELEARVSGLLPAALRAVEARSGEELLAHLGDPLRFASVLDDALSRAFVRPFIEGTGVQSLNDRPETRNARLPIGPAELIGSDDDWLASSVQVLTDEAVKQVSEGVLALPLGLEMSVEDLLADLETLEWIVLGHLPQGARLLDEIHSRYALAPASKGGEQPTVWYALRHHVQRLRDNWNRLP
ncbi:MAG: hypothetical protein ISS56_04320 [Anaerolineae bacterium]|nr:hypothetical protein [Anaerolineae bacterium]